MYTAVKDSIEREIDFNPNIGANAEKNPLVLEPITQFAIKKR